MNKQSISKIVDMSLSTILTLSLFMLLTYIIYFPRYLPIDVGVRNLKWDDNRFKICSRPELADELEDAVEEWRTGIAYFGLRFLWLDLLDYKLEIIEKGDIDECEVSFKFIENPLGVRDGRLATASTVFERDGRNVKKATVYIWKGLLHEALKEDLENVLVHEIAWVLGLVPSIYYNYSGEPLGLASDMYGEYSVTSLDAYPLKLRLYVDDLQAPGYYTRAPAPLLRIIEAIIPLERKL